jgi:membrane associated rhomboid family serine protease
MAEEDLVEVQSPGSFTRFVARLPFTLCFMAAIVLGVTAASTLMPGGIDAATARFGLTIRGLAQGELWRILTATVLASSFAKLGEQILFVAGMIGVYEYLHGTRRAIVIFWATDVVAKLVMVPIFLGPLGSMLSAGIVGIVTTPDVGMSGGGMGLLAGSLHGLAGRYRPAVLVAGLVFLTVKFLVWPQPLSDVLHLLTFSLGWTLSAVANRR